MSAPQHTEEDRQGGSPAPRIYGWPDRQQGTASGTASAGPPVPPARDRQAAGDTTGPAAGDHQPGTASAGDLIQQEVAVPAEGEGGALVMRSRVVVSAQEAAHGLRFANMRNKSLAEVLQFARDGEDNLSHFLAYYAFKVAFFYWVTVPVLSVVEYVKWVHVRPHRFMFVWFSFFLAAGVLNRFADGLVPDGLDVSTWSPITWAWIAGAAFVLLLATVVTYVRNQ